MTERQPTPRDIARAIDRDEFHLAYQPQVEVTSGRLCGVEVLARWRHPRLGVVPPSIFVPVAEQTRLIDRLTEWIVRTALQQATEWRDARLEISIAINISPANLTFFELPDLLTDLCAKFEVPPQQLTIEITEGTAQHMVSLMDNLSRFRLKGMKVSLDDFGTGYSSIARLHQLPFSEIKIDQSFVSDIHRSRDSRAVTKAIIELAHALDMTSLGEGVESQEALDVLAELGCDKAQGHYIGRPMAGDELLRWAQSRPSFP
ncbi:EAL domain-containing protein [Croceicoccus ponticola]|uniref:EAL domain-containing protein n=1 Tax=Croceicoccus ponticola TaxID=2217664 RepID=A0A437GZ37_9SPHN|nr:EAL domain-containing protein [Croceicoccus ponticola]RVQ67525.1 EAL domain-containing protein [Croceicoccus ponticola]